jgi:SAM-dependent methyltransferase
MDHNNKFTKMQQKIYDEGAAVWTLEYRDPVVGFFDEHNAWKDYDIYLFKGIDTTNKLALDFGCGPGRNAVKFIDRFQQIDGTDISAVNLSKAQIWFKANNFSKTYNLYKTNGVDLSAIESNKYDIVFSTIAFQHICVHEIRFNFLKEFFRVLKNNSHMCFQMGFGPGHPNSVGYYENNYDFMDLNNKSDTRVNHPDELKSDLEKVGFVDFDYDIRPTGPGDSHSNWIYFRARKP